MERDVTGLAKATASRWTTAALAELRQDAATTIPLIDLVAVASAKADGRMGLDLWDMWPLQLANGATARFDGAALWMILSAPVLADSDLRHAMRCPMGFARAAANGLGRRCSIRRASR